MGVSVDYHSPNLAEKCERCQHGWHGLACTRQTADYSGGPGGTCGCPSAWKEPAA